MVAEEENVLSPIWLGVSGASAPSMTAKLLSTFCGTPKVATIDRSTSS